MTILIVLAAFITLVQSWWVLAYLYAYRQVQKRILLLQVVQGAVFGLFFALITLSLVSPQQYPLNGALSAVLLIMGFVPGFIWRRRDGIMVVLDHYPNGIIDVMLFRKALNV
jgi:hypothetical protein